MGTEKEGSGVLRGSWGVKQGIVNKVVLLSHLVHESLIGVGSRGGFCEGGSFRWKGGGDVLILPMRRLLMYQEQECK